MLRIETEQGRGMGSMGEHPVLERVMPEKVGFE